MDEQQINENKTPSGDDIACPNCGSHNVRCVPYPKVEFGAWFILWLVVAFGGYMISVFITIAGIVFWSIALVIRLKQNKLAKQYIRMQCITCGESFDVARGSLTKRGRRSMTQDYLINTFGLTQKQNQFISANLPVRYCELYIADTPTDLIAINCEAMIVNASAMEQDDANMIFGYYQEVNGCTDETILWLGEPMPPNAARKFFKCYPDFDAITDKLKYLLLSAHSRSRKSYEYSEKLVNGLKILSLIRKRPGISTQTLTELTELPLRNVQRYISALQATGEWIEYNRSLRRWKLFHGFSILYGDVWEEGAE